jgi:tRNA(Arg) A34 adenosine deaminase TadA
LNTGEAERYLREAIHLAELAAQHGNHPFGALLVCDGKVILAAENTVATDHDCTRHAELNLVSQACRQFDAATLASCTLYTSTEPCPMCSGAIYWSGITRVVYACSAERLALVMKRVPLASCREIMTRGKEAEIIGPLLEDEAAVHHQRHYQ